MKHPLMAYRLRSYPGRRGILLSGFSGSSLGKVQLLRLAFVLPLTATLIMKKLCFYKQWFVKVQHIWLSHTKASGNVELLLILTHNIQVG